MLGYNISSKLDHNNYQYYVETTLQWILLDIIPALLFHRRHQICERYTRNTNIQTAPDIGKARKIVF